MINQPYLDWLHLAEAAARQAGTLIRQMLDENVNVRSKGFRDLVTDADIASQKLITDMIRDRFPDHGFLAEEEDTDLPTHGPIRWAIDPVDGTSNYSHRIPTFCVSIGVAIQDEAGDDEVQAGVIYAPMLDEFYSAARGHGARLNGRPIHVSAVETLADVTLGLDWGRGETQRTVSFNALNQLGHRVTGLRAIGSAALALAWVAAGRYDAYINPSLGPWDIAAGGLLVTEAGGSLTDLAGTPIVLGEARNCIATNGFVRGALEGRLLGSTAIQENVHPR